MARRSARDDRETFEESNAAKDIQCTLDVEDSNE